MTTDAAGRFAYRLALRSEEAGHVGFLEHLRNSVFGDDLILCGSAAIHGVHIHGRRTPVLDFVAEPSVALRCAEGLKSVGVDVQQWAAGHQLTAPADSRLFGGMEVMLKVYSLAKLPAGSAPLHYADTRVRTLPLANLAIAKLGRAFVRGSALDFVDLWMIARARPELAQEIPEAWAKLGPSNSSHVPARPLEVDRLMRRLRDLGNRWESGMADLVYPIPRHSDIVGHLCEWLPQLSHST
jgi:hypothetical protein